MSTTTEATLAPAKQESAAAVAAPARVVPPQAILLTNTEQGHQARLAVVRESGYEIRNMRESYRTEDLCLAAVSKEGHAIRYVPKALQTKEMCMAAIKQNGFALIHLKPDQCSPELYLAAVQVDGHVIKFVPFDQRTPQMCLDAVSRTGYAIRHLTPEQRTHDVCWVAVTQSLNCLTLLALAEGVDEHDARDFLRDNWQVVVDGVGEAQAEALEKRYFDKPEYASCERGG